MILAGVVLPRSTMNFKMSALELDQVQLAASRTFPLGSSTNQTRNTRSRCQSSSWTTLKYRGSTSCPTAWMICKMRRSVWKTNWKYTTKTSLVDLKGRQRGLKRSPCGTFTCTTRGLSSTSRKGRSWRASSKELIQGAVQALKWEYNKQGQLLVQGTRLRQLQIPQVEVVLSCSKSAPPRVAPLTLPHQVASQAPSQMRRLQSTYRLMSATQLSSRTTSGQHWMWLGNLLK